MAPGRTRVRLEQLSDGQLARAEVLFARCVELEERAAQALLAAEPDRDLRSFVAGLLADDGELAWIDRPLVLVDARDVELPATVGPWTVTGQLGRGGESTVLRVERPRGVGGRTTVEQAALKLLAPGLDGERELRARRAVDHPAFPTLIDSGRDRVGSGERTWIAYEAVGGQQLATWAQGHSHAARVGAWLQVAGAIAALHRAGFEHLDLKPSNLLVDADAVVRVLDLGASIALGDTVLGRRGTPGYTAPEVAVGARADGRADVYSLGVLLRDVLGSRTTPPLSAVVEAAIQTDPARRPSSPAALIDGVAVALARGPVDDRATAAPSSPAEKGRPGTGRGPWLFFERCIEITLARPDLRGAGTVGLEAIEHLLESWPFDIGDRAHGHLALGQAWRQVGRLEVAERHFRRAIDGLAGRDEQEELWLEALGWLGIALRERGELEAAMEPHLTVVERREALFGRDDERTLNAIGQLGLLRKVAGELSSAEALLTEAACGLERLPDADRRHVGVAIANRGLLLLEFGRCDEALFAVERASVALHEAFGPDHPQSCAADNTLAMIERRLGRPAAAGRRFRELAPRQERSMGVEHPWCVSLRINLAASLREASDLEGAERELARAEALVEHVVDPIDVIAIMSRLERARLDRDAGRGEAAREGYRGLAATVRELPDGHKLRQVVLEEGRALGLGVEGLRARSESPGVPKAPPS